MQHKRIHIFFLFCSFFYACLANNAQLSNLAHLEIQLNHLSSLLESIQQEETKKTLFVSFELPDEMREQLKLIQQQTKNILGPLAQARYLNPEDFHLIMYYLGKQNVKEVNEKLKSTTDILKKKLSDLSQKPYQITFNQHPAFINSENIGPLAVLWANDCMLDEVYEKIKEILEPFQASEYPIFFKHLTLGKIFNQKNNLTDINLINLIIERFNSLNLPAITMPVSSFNMQSGPLKSPMVIGVYSLEYGTASLQTNESQERVFFPFIAPASTQQSIIDGDITGEIEKAMQRIKKEIKPKPKQAFYFDPSIYHMTLYYSIENPNIQAINNALSNAMPVFQEIYNMHKNNVRVCLGGFQLTNRSEKLLGPQGITWGKPKFIPGHFKGQELLVIPVYGHYLNEIQSKIVEQLRPFKEPDKLYDAHITIARLQNPSPEQKANILENITIPTGPFNLTSLILYDVIRGQVGAAREYNPIKSFQIG